MPSKYRKYSVRDTLYALEVLGVDFQAFTKHHFRTHLPAPTTIDLWPSTRKFHVLETGERGTYDDLLTFLTKRLADGYA